MGPMPSTTSPTVTETPVASTDVDNSAGAGVGEKDNDDELAVGPPSESNAYVEAIGPLRLSSALSEVIIVGGTSEFGTQGKTIKLRIDSQMLTQSPHVTSLWISNCDIGEQLSTGSVLSAMPAGLTDLNLRNVRMRIAPNDLAALENLRTLSMEQNFLTTLSPRLSLAKLTTLALSENALTTMEANFPALEILILNKNNLFAIPDAVYAMSNLQELQLTGNPIAAIVISTSQNDFLTHVRLKIDAPLTTPPRPELYIRGPVNGSVSIEAAALDLDDDANADWSAVVTVGVGSLTNLQGFPAWVLSDAEFEAFRRQQRAIAKNGIVVGGRTVETYESITISDSAGSRSDTRQVGEAMLPNAAAPNNPRREAPSIDIDASSGKLALGVSLAVIVSIAALSVVLLLVCFCRRRTSAKAANSGDAKVTTLTTPEGESISSSFQLTTASDTTSNTLDAVRNAGTTTTTTPAATTSDLFLSRRVRVADLEDMRPIDSSASSVVWLVRMRGARLCVAKRLIPSAATSPHRMNEFMNEIVVSATLDHPGIVGFVGVAWTNEADLQALYEYMPNGDLQAHLYEHTSPASLPWSSAKLALAIGVIEALVYTHSFRPSLLHRNVRAKNVLLNGAMNPKLSDFGSARAVSEQNTMTTQRVGSGRWLAPEVLRGETDYDAASDVYAFGVLLSELDTHAAPYEHELVANGISEVALLETVARGALRPSFSPSCPQQILAAATRCLSNDPQARPSAMRVAYELRQLARQWRRATEQGPSREGA